MPTPEIPRIYTHWVNYAQKRIFLVVDRPVDDVGYIILMEVKDYPPDEERHIQRLSPMDWMLLTQDGTQLKPYTPRL